MLSRFFAAIACGLVFNLSVVVSAAKPQKPDSDDPEKGFVSIFDGKTLNGWMGATDAYTIEDGAIKCIEGSKGNLLTEKEYSNFVLRFEFKLAPAANNGLAIRTPNEQGSLAYKGMELQIIDNSAEKWKDIKVWQKHGSLYGIAPAKVGYLKPVGEWNEQEVTVRGRRVKVVLNGETILNINIDQAMKDGTLSGKEHPGALRQSGHIGFLGHGDVIWARNLRIKELKK